MFLARLLATAALSAKPDSSQKYKIGARSSHTTPAKNLSKKNIRTRKAPPPLTSPKSPPEGGSKCL